ncbi:hypothetical protein F5Y15DRAFT_123880 [Xylariaceae sp. FL0016]|nr:hypothetical protein F5Y15DRAFT_123880 [Xylariaceae sp. FL0016]
MPSLTTIALALASAASLAVAKPISAATTTTTSPTSIATTSCPSGSAATVLRTPTMYALDPSQPSATAPTVSQLEVQRASNVTVRYQLAVFADLPDSPASCTLGWSQADADQRDFNVTGNGLLNILQLSSRPDVVTTGAVAALEEEARAAGSANLHPDTTFWSEPQYPASDHIAGPVACGESVYLSVQKDERMGDGYVFLDQDALNGLTLNVTTCL